jgi:type I restriction enzyme S subunit
VRGKLAVVSNQLPDGWQVKKLGDVCNLIGGGTPSKKNEEFYTGDIPWLL